MESAPSLPVKVVMTPSAAQRHDAGTIARPGYDSKLDLTVFVSCYNEQEYIIKTLDTVRASLAEVNALSYEIIVIDDCSKDNSADVVEEYIRANPEEQIVLRRNGLNVGWAQNFIDGAFIGKGRYYRAVCGDASEPKSTMVS